MPARGRVPKFLQSKAIHLTGSTINQILLNLNGTGTFRIFIGTASSIGGTITWEETTVTSISFTLSNPNTVLYYRIIGSNGAELFPTGITPGVQIQIIS